MLEVDNLCKSYKSFNLSNVSFKLEEGYIMGFIGANGAGKTTTLKCILNIANKDEGKVNIFGKDMDVFEEDIKQDIGFMQGEFDYYAKTKIQKIVKVYSSFYKNWDNAVYRKYLKRFAIDENKKVSELSTGMKVKLALTMALSHNAKLFIFDEPTSGLDPLARNELLELFAEIIEDGSRSILFSTHITSDLDKCADYIIFIKEGKLIANTSKDDLTASHKLVGGSNEYLTDGLKKRMVGYKENKFGFHGLIKTSDLLPEDNINVETPNIEDIMLFYLEAKND